TTIAGNKTGPAGKGGGIELDTPGNIPSATVINSTILGNSANIGGNVSDTLDGEIPFFIANTIIGGGVLIGSSPIGPDLNGTGIVSQQNNLIQSTASTNFFALPSDIVGKSPLLLSLGNYGGPTPSMPPQPNSPAIKAGAQAIIGDF